MATEWMLYKTIYLFTCLQVMLLQKCQEFQVRYLSQLSLNTVGDALVVLHQRGQIKLDTKFAQNIIFVVLAYVPPVNLSNVVIALWLVGNVLQTYAGIRTRSWKSAITYDTNSATNLSGKN